MVFRIQTFNRLASTQDEMRSRLERNENVHDLVIRALEQTAGRGRNARDWQSSPGGSYQTVAIAMPQAQAHAAIAMATGIAESLRQQAIQAKIKWPNDLYLKQKKLGGVLCEYSKGYLLIGAGINVRNTIPDIAASLPEFETETISTIVLEGIQKGVGYLQDTSLPERFAALDILKGHRVSVHTGHQLKTGIARGIDQRGCLRLEQPHKTLTICSGHIGHWTPES